MNETLAALTERFIRNRDAVKDVMEQVGAAYEKAIGYPCAFYVASIGGGPREL